MTDRSPRGARGSHAPSLTTLAARALEVALTADEKRAECTILVAVSGGPDSMALLDALARLRKRFEGRLQLVACGVDHGLRAEAEAELRLGAELAGAHGVPWVTRRVVVAPGANLQARAREARHRVLAEEAGRLEEEGRARAVGSAGGAGAILIATAHHAEDRAETFLLRLARGAGVNGLGVLPLRAGNLVRPILHARRADVITHLDRHRIPFAKDPSNANRRFDRVRVREDVLPALLAIDPRFVEHVGQLCEELAAMKRVGPVVELAAEQEGLEGLGRRTREALARLGPDAPRKMAVKLPKGRIATYDQKRSCVVIHTEPDAPRTVRPPQTSGPSTPKTRKLQ